MGVLYGWFHGHTVYDKVLYVLPVSLASYVICSFRTHVLFVLASFFAFLHTF